MQPDVVDKALDPLYNTQVLQEPIQQTSVLSEDKLTTSLNRFKESSCEDPSCILVVSKTQSVACVVNTVTETSSMTSPSHVSSVTNDSTCANSDSIAFFTHISTSDTLEMENYDKSVENLHVDGLTTCTATPEAPHIDSCDTPSALVDYNPAPVIHLASSSTDVVDVATDITKTEGSLALSAGDPFQQSDTFSAIHEPAAVELQDASGSAYSDSQYVNTILEAPEVAEIGVLKSNTETAILSASATVPDPSLATTSFESHAGISQHDHITLVTQIDSDSSSVETLAVPDVHSPAILAETDNILENSVNNTMPPAENAQEVVEDVVQTTALDDTTVLGDCHDNCLEVDNVPGEVIGASIIPCESDVHTESRETSASSAVQLDSMLADILDESVLDDTISEVMFSSSTPETSLQLISVINEADDVADSPFPVPASDSDLSKMATTPSPIKHTPHDFAPSNLPASSLPSSQVTEDGMEGDKRSLNLNYESYLNIRGMSQDIMPIEEIPFASQHLDAVCSSSPVRPSSPPPIFSSSPPRTFDLTPPSSSPRPNWMDEKCSESIESPSKMSGLDSNVVLGKRRASGDIQENLEQINATDRFDRKPFKYLVSTIECMCDESIFMSTP